MNKIAFTIGLMCSLAAGTALAEEAPSYDERSRTLSIPRVDTAAAPGPYRNARLVLAEDGRWELRALTEAKPATVESVEVLKVDTRPAQVFVQISGYLPTPCDGLAPVSVRRTDARFEVAVRQLILQTFVACAQVLAPFKVTTPLDVFQLPAGRYEIAVNGITRSFVLSEDNTLPVK
jgi:hypothetical protein